MTVYETTPMSREESIQFWSLLIVGAKLEDVQRFMNSFALERERELRAEWVRQGTAILEEAEAGIAIRPEWPSPDRHTAQEAN